ncbi:hypothetical protein Mapa_016938 [Marchantia paleacea]|nr:hypothetical protein Mapa_016938 [Marchantia paleacea]
MTRVISIQQVSCWKVLELGKVAREEKETYSSEITRAQGKLFVPALLDPEVALRMKDPEKLGRKLQQLTLEFFKNHVLNSPRKLVDRCPDRGSINSPTAALLHLIRNESIPLLRRVHRYIIWSTLWSNESATSHQQSNYSS